MTIAVAVSAIKDPHSKWTRNFQLAPEFDVEGFQKKLNAIAGLTQANEPVLKLTWAGNEGWFEVDGTEWVERPRYAFLSRQQHNYGQAIPIRRWIIEENTDPGQLDAMGGKDGRLKVAEKGFYSIWLLIADHAKCAGKCSEKKICYGDYRHPDDSDLAYIKEVTFRIMTDKNRPDPRKMVVPEMIIPYMPKALDEKAQAEADEIENKEYIKDWIKVHGVARTSNQKPS